MNRTIRIMAMILWSPVLALAQPKITTSTDTPSPGESVVLEVNVKPSANVSINWDAAAEGGSFDGPKNNVSKVRFVPSQSGTIIVICLIKEPGLEQRVTTELRVAGTLAPAQAKPEAPKPLPTKPSVNPPPAPAPANGVLPLRSIPDIVVSGFMGDGMVENGASAKFDPGEDRGCHAQGGQSCFRVEYTEKAKLGWAAFAWQYVTEGTDNWGRTPGYNFGRDYQSLRLWAKGQEDAGTLPRVQFKSGGNVAPEFAAKNKPSHNVAGPTVRLSREWALHCLDLRGKDLSNVISPLTVVVTRASNPKGAIFWIDDVELSRETCRP